MKLLFLLLGMLMLSAKTYALDPPSIVYRCDTRPLDEINQAGGFFPNDYRGARDYDLMRHFSGEEVEHHTSGFVSVGYEFQDVIKHCIALLESEGYAYIYRIIPGSNFYSVSNSLAAARDAQPATSQQRGNIQRLIELFDNMHEYVAVDGFVTGRVEQYSILTEALVRHYYDGQETTSPLLTESFWSSRWAENPQFNSAFIGEVANANIYTILGTEVNELNEVNYALGDRNLDIPVRFTCQFGLPKNKASNKSSRCYLLPVVKKIVATKAIASQWHTIIN